MNIKNINKSSGSKFIAISFKRLNLFLVPWQFFESNLSAISSTDKMTLYCHIISKFKRVETQRICFIQLHIAMTLGLKLKYLKTRMTVKFQLQLSLDAYQIYIWVEDLRTFSQLKNHRHPEVEAHCNSTSADIHCVVDYFTLHLKAFESLLIPS